MHLCSIYCLVTDGTYFPGHVWKLKNVIPQYVVLFVYSASKFYNKLVAEPLLSDDKFAEPQFPRFDGHLIYEYWSKLIMNFLKIQGVLVSDR